MIDQTRVETIKARLKKTGVPEDQSSIKPAKWQEYYSTDVAYLIQEIEAQAEDRPTQKKKRGD